jgi:hypothetical protein
MNTITKVGKGFVCGGSVPVLIVGCRVEVGVADGRGMLKVGTSKSVIALTKGL